MVQELITNLGMALAGITVISLLLLIHPLAVLLVLFTVVTVDLCLFMEMWVLDIEVNTISVVNLVMAVGALCACLARVLHESLTHRSYGFSASRS